MHIQVSVWLINDYWFASTVMSMYCNLWLHVLPIYCNHCISSIFRKSSDKSMNCCLKLLLQCKQYRDKLVMQKWKIWRKRLENLQRYRKIFNWIKKRTYFLWERGCGRLQWCQMAKNVHCWNEDPPMIHHSLEHLGRLELSLQVYEKFINSRKFI